MKKILFPGLAAAALLAGAAGAQQMPKVPAMPEAVKAAPEKAGEATKAAKAAEVSGELKSIDKEKRSLTLSPLSGVKKDITVADGATITRDGAAAALDQLKEGDEVRATFDATTNQATTLEVHSKQMKK